MCACQISLSTWPALTVGAVGVYDGPKRVVASAHSFRSGLGFLLRRHCRLLIGRAVGTECSTHVELFLGTGFSQCGDAALGRSQAGCRVVRRAEGGGLDDTNPLPAFTRQSLGSRPSQRNFGDSERGRERRVGLFQMGGGPFSSGRTPLMTGAGSLRARFEGYLRASQRRSLRGGGQSRQACRCREHRLRSGSEATQRGGQWRRF